MTFDPEKLHDFLARGDKSPPPVFVGRDGVLKDIEEAGATAWKGRSETIAGKQVQHGVAGMTRIVQGAPGAGKTSILAELFSRSSERHGAPGQSRVLTVGSRQLLDNLPDVLHAVAAAACTPGAASNAATAASIASSVPGVRAARQSGRRLNVVWDSRQYQRATRAPAGVLRP